MTSLLPYKVKLLLKRLITFFSAAYNDLLDLTLLANKRLRNIVEVTIIS